MGEQNIAHPSPASAALRRDEPQVGGTGQSNSFTVCLVRADGGSDVVCHNASSHDAAREFWHRSNNVSAISGRVRRVSIVDNYGCTNLAWEFGRGFTFDGMRFHPKPVLPADL
jgi:hypothetical protein